MRRALRRAICARGPQTPFHSSDVQIYRSLLFDDFQVYYRRHHEGTPQLQKDSFYKSTNQSFSNGQQAALRRGLFYISYPWYYKWTSNVTPW